MVLQFLLAALLGGTGWIWVPFQLKYLPFEFAVAYRFLLAGGGLLIFAYFTQRKEISFSWKTHLLFLLQGILFFGANYVLCYQASQYIPTGLIAITLALQIIPTFFLSYLFFQEKVSVRFFLGMMLGIMGLVITFYHSQFNMGTSQNVFLGFSLAFGSTVLGAVGTLLSRNLSVHRVPVLWQTGFSML